MAGEKGIDISILMAGKKPMMPSPELPLETTLAEEV
jgi:hypothetical protein